MCVVVCVAVCVAVCVVVLTRQLADRYLMVTPSDVRL